MRHKVIITTVSFLILVVVIGGFIHFKQFKPTLPELGPPSAESTEITPGSAKVWIGLKNSDDQGTNFDLRAELLKNGTVIASGETRCITGVTRNPDKAKEVTVPLSPIANVSVVSGDVLSLRMLTRIGTNPNGTKCAGHSNAVGLRLYYDTVNLPSRFSWVISPDPLTDFFFHADTTDFFDIVTSTATVAKFKDSPGVNFKNGNLWQAIGNWGMVVNVRQTPFGELVIQPLTITAQVPTTIFSEISIPDSELIPQSVRLDRLDETGKIIAALGNLRDDGQGGDLKAGDKRFAAEFMFNEPSQTLIHLRASAAFNGVLQRILSTEQRINQWC
jgi:hypothetical protein